MLPNLLNLALRVLPQQTVQWFAQTGEATQANGLIVPSFAPGMPVVGSFQVVGQTELAQLGLDFKQDYVRFYTSTLLNSASLDAAGDQFVFAGARYQVLSNNDWHNVNGWLSSMAVKLQP